MLCALHVEVVAAVEVAVADGFHDVVLADGDAGFEVGDGASDLEDAVVGSRAHVHLGDGFAQLFHSLGVGFGVFVQQCCGHLGVAVHAWVVLEAQALDGSRFDDSLPDCRAWLAWLLARHLLEIDGLNLHLQINSIQQRPTNLAHILMPLMRCADALLRWMSVEATRTRIHRSHKHKRGGIVNAVFRSADADVPVLKWLAHNL